MVEHKGIEPLTSGLQMHALEIPKKSALTYSVIDLRFYKSMVYYKEYKIVLRNLFRWEFVGQVLRIRWATKVFELIRDSWRNRNEKRMCMEYTAGSLSTTKDGKWRGILRYKDADGKWRSKEKKLKSKGKRDAQKELNAWREEMEKEAAYLSSSEHLVTVGEYVSTYIKSRKTFVEPSTISGYRTLFNTKIAPYIGEILLDDLKPDDVQRWVNSLTDKYSAVTVRKAFTLLRSAMIQAVERDRLEKNPTRTVKPPKLPAPKPNALDEASRAVVMRMVDAEDLSPIMLAVKIALFTGMREGEVCGLRWRDVNLDEMSLSVREALGNNDGVYYVKEPKTAGSRRTIFYPATLRDSLSRRRTAMQKACLAAGIPFTEKLYVLGEISGEFMRPEFVGKRWREIAQALDLNGTEGRRPTFHDLRHTYATVAIANGVDVKTVSSSMGHSNAAMTLNTYASADPEAKRKAAAVMASAYATDARRGRGENVIKLDMTGTGE